MFGIHQIIRSTDSGIASRATSKQGDISMPDILLWGFRSCLGGVMRIFSRNMTATLSMGLIGLLFAPLLHAQEYPADTTRGKAVYERTCQACHGVGGWGDGPDAQALKVAPANFHRFSSFLKSDEELLRTIEHGVVFSPMHSWRGQLTDGEMQDVVSYIRLLSQQGR
jgi:mono/diheme cytochrome c family protein